jgi:lipoprotein NlpD
VSKHSDGYVTSKEIGLWISQTLPSILPGQNPHSDVIRDTRFMFGDMVFEMPKKTREARRTAAPPPPPSLQLALEPTASAANQEQPSWIWPTDGKIVSTFEEGKNKGIDIAGKAGQKIMAVDAGKVMYAGSGIRGYGNMVIVKHSNSLLSAYAHNRTMRVKEGQEVSRGQVIAEMGDTDTDSVKLHLEVREQGKPVDPARFLPSR